MDVLDPRLALIGAGVAAVGSDRVRKVLGRGVGYAAAGAMKVGEPVVNAGRDIVDEAREVAGNGSSSRSRTSRSTSSRSKSS